MDWMPAPRPVATVSTLPVLFDAFQLTFCDSAVPTVAKAICASSKLHTGYISRESSGDVSRVKVSVANVQTQRSLPEFASSTATRAPSWEMLRYS